jgi:zinc protease
MSIRPLLGAAVAAALFTGGIPAAAQPLSPAELSQAAQALSELEIDIPYTKYVLDNGLTLIVHTDDTAPVVHFNIWYHVGSKNEPQGQTGFAHLFEHLMFQGSENFNDDYFQATRQLGATQQNGTTSNDRTNYFQTVPKEALDAILWLESDRMGHFLGAVDQARLDEQRGVVQNEKRQGDNQPYAIARDLIIHATYPNEHPYGHSVIGSMEDLDAATLEQAREWFEKYYGASNAVIALAGDITPEEALAKVERYFGWVPAGEPVAHPKTWIVRNTGEQREVAYDRVSAPRLYKVWSMPNFGSTEGAQLDVFANLLAGDRTARLTRRLVYEEQIATQVSAAAAESEIAGQFQIIVQGQPDADMTRIEAIVDEEVARLIAEGPTESELEKVRADYVSGQVRQLEQINSKASILATSETYFGDPGRWKQLFEIYRSATGPEIQAAAREWLTDGSYALTILPFEYRATGQDVDRSNMPVPDEVALAEFPPVQRTRLSNGIDVLLVERRQAPVVSIDLVIDTAYGPDFAAEEPGLGGLAVALMDEGTQSRDALELADELIRIGARLGVGGGGQQSTVSVNALKPTLDQALDIFADVTLNPAFRPEDVERVRAQQIAGLRSARLNPASIAGRVMSKIVYGESHPFGRLETEGSLAAITREDLAAFHARWFAPQNATLIVVGDTTLAEITPKLEAALGGWRNPGAASPIEIALPQMAGAPVVYLVDRPGSPQSYILAGLPAAPRDPATDAEFFITAFNTSFGGNFTSRINMNLREDKGWSYGVNSGVGGGRGPRLFRITAQVQTDKTKESIQELLKELDDALLNRPLTAAEIATSQNNIIMGLASRWQSSAAVAASLDEMITYGLPDAYFDDYASKVQGVTPEQALAAGQSLIPSRNFAWVVVGDRAEVAPGLHELGMEVRVIDADGNPLP